MTERHTATLRSLSSDHQSESFTSSTRRSTGRDGGTETARPRSAAAMVAVAVETAAAAAAAAAAAVVVVVVVAAATVVAR